MTAEIKPLRVSELNRHIKGMFMEDALLNDVSVEGELSNVKYHSSGHIYFTLKDEESCISGVMFASDAYGLSFILKAGDKVVVSGRVSVYEKAGTYQIYAKRVKAAGLGELYRKFEELKKMLSEEGMFDKMYKKPIPFMAEKIGVVTAPTGAAVRDIINVAKRRNPFIEILFYPALVQGEGAADSIVKGIRILEKKKPDVIIIGRGGGSIEDLWAFNEEKLARAVFDCSVPIISGTGHETDVTIADLVADLRAPTPSAAAELAVSDYFAFMDSLSGYRDRLLNILDRKIDRYKKVTLDYQSKLGALSPKARLLIQKEKAVRYGESLKTLINKVLRDKSNRRSIYAEQLSALSPLNTLSRGYTFTENERGGPVRSINDVKTGDLLKIYTKDGRIMATVDGTEKI